MSRSSTSARRIRSRCRTSFRRPRSCARSPRRPAARCAASRPAPGDAIVMPRVVGLNPSPSYGGSDYIGIKRTGSSELIGVRSTSLASGFFGLALLLGMVIIAWVERERRLEARRRQGATARRPRLGALRGRLGRRASASNLQSFCGGRLLARAAASSDLAASRSARNSGSSCRRATVAAPMKRPSITSLSQCTLQTRRLSRRWRPLRSTAKAGRRRRKCIGLAARVWDG